MSDIHNHIKFISEEIVLNTDSTNLLGLLLIGGTGKYDINRGTAIDNIMNKHRESHDVLSAQDEMLDAGFKEQARF